MEDDEAAIKAFQLVEFDPPNKKLKRGTIECVPSTWISFNSSTGRCECKFMPPPYSVANSELLRSLVKEQCPPLESWPVYPMTLKAHATTYSDAMKRLIVLEDKKFAYTEDGTLAEKKSEEAKKAYQRIKIKGDKAIAEKLMQVQPIKTSGNDNYGSDIDSSIETSEPISLDDNSIKLKKTHKNRKNMTETESTDENSNVINKPRKKPNPKSKNKQVTKIKEHVSSTGRDRVEETRGTSSNNISLSHKSKLKDSMSSTRRFQHASPAPQAASAVNRDQADELKAQNSCRSKAVPEKSKTHPSFRSSNNHTMSKENSSELNQKECDVLTGLRHDVQLLTVAINELKGIVKRSALAQDAHGATVQSFATQYNQKLPVTSLELFDAFDEKLKADKKFRKEFASTLHFMFDQQVTLSKNITALLKKNISRDVALSFTAVKASVGKRIFKDTQLCGIFLDVLLLKCKEGAQGSMTHITEKSFYRELGNCLSNAIDWDGHRKSRLEKKTKSTVITGTGAVHVTSPNCTSTESLSHKSLSNATS